MTTRMLRWFFLSLLFALIPLTVVLSLQWLAGGLTASSLEDNSSEILFFSLMVSVTVMGDTIEANKQIGRDDLVYALMMFFMFGAVMTAVLYGFFQFNHLVGTTIADFGTKVMWLSIVMAVILFLVGTGTQVFLGRVTDAREVTQ